MSMSDLMSRLGGHDLAVYPQIAVVIFLAVFVAIAVRVWWRGRGTPQKAEYARAAAMPLDDDSTTAVRPSGARTMTEASR